MECPSWIFVGCYKKDTTSAEIFIRSIVGETNAAAEFVGETDEAAEFAGERSADLAGGRRSENNDVWQRSRQQLLARCRLRGCMSTHQVRISKIASCDIVMAPLRRQQPLAAAAA